MIGKGVVYTELESARASGERMDTTEQNGHREWIQQWTKYIYYINTALTKNGTNIFQLYILIQFFCYSHLNLCLLTHTCQLGLSREDDTVPSHCVFCPAHQAADHGTNVVSVDGR